MIYARETALVATPVGTVRIDGDVDHIHAIAISRDQAAGRRPDYPAVLAAAEQLEAFFAGELRAFDVALAPAKTARGAVLRQVLIDVSYGKTMAYGQLARLAGSSARAIGQLCARNPFPIIVPCHRILAATGLGHYSAGDGPTTKQWLLDHERRNFSGESS